MCSFSNYSPTKVDLAAPGINMWSTSNSDSPGSLYSYSSGARSAGCGHAMLRVFFPGSPVLRGAGSPDLSSSF